MYNQGIQIGARHAAFLTHDLHATEFIPGNIYRAIGATRPTGGLHGSTMASYRPNVSIEEHILKY